MEEQLELLNKLENEYGVVFQEFESTPTCVKCDHDDGEEDGEHSVQYISGLDFTDEEGNEEHVGFEHLTLTCPTCGYSFRSLTKDLQEVYEESLQEAEESEDEGEIFKPIPKLGEGDISDGMAAITDLGLDLARRVADDFGSVFESEPKPKKPSKLTKIFFEEKKEE